ncbi:MAG: MFS transporter [bacterium]|nr:MFS transporter [bacterium]
MDQENNKINKTLKFSFFDGIFASLMTGFTNDYFVPFLLVIGGTARSIGILSALPNLFGALAQAKTPDIVEKVRSRKKIIIGFVLLQALMLLPVIFLDLFGKLNQTLFIACVILFTSFNAIASPAWGSLMSDLVHGDKRGSYFGWRNKTLGFITVIASFAAGYILYVMKNINIFAGFIIIFSAAFIFRMISCYFLTRMHEPHCEYKEKDYFTVFDFLARARESNFAKFVFFISLMSFSVNLCSPFFAVLMLEDLHFSYLIYIIVVSMANLTIHFMTDRWGRLADRTGNLRILKFVTPLIALVPLLWLINRSPLFLMGAQIFSGFAWAGFNLCATNFIYDAVSPGKRTRCIAYFNMFNGLAVCLGALLGGFLIQKLPPLLGYKILTIVLISSVLRLIVGIFMPMMLKEVKPVDEVSNTDLFFSVIGIKAVFRIGED